MKIKESTDHTERSTFFEDGTAIIIRYSPFSGKFYKAMLNLTEEQYLKWKNGRELIQNAMPQLSAEEREFLKTGYTPEDWAAMFPPREEGDADED